MQGSARYGLKIECGIRFPSLGKDSPLTNGSKVEPQESQTASTDLSCLVDVSWFLAVLLGILNQLE